MPTIDIPQKILNDLKELYNSLPSLFTEIESYIIKEEEREYLLVFKHRTNTTWFPLESYTNLKDAMDAYDKVVENKYSFIQYKIIMNARFNIVDCEDK